MQSVMTGSKLGMLLAAGLAVCACSGDSEGSDPGAGGTGGAGVGGTVSAGGTTSGGTGGTVGGTGGTVGSGGSNAGGASSSGGSAGAGTGGSTGGSNATGGSGGSGGEPCTPASTDEIPYSGTCTYADHCTDEYDTTFGADLLQQICESQSGTWSTTPCSPSDWDIKCTQEVLGGVYIQYMLADGICAIGCEEPL